MFRFFFHCFPSLFLLSLFPFPMDVDFYENPLRAEKSSAPRDCNAALETQRCSSLVCEFLGQCCLWRGRRTLEKLASRRLRKQFQLPDSKFSLALPTKMDSSIRSNYAKLSLTLIIFIPQLFETMFHRSIITRQSSIIHYSPI